MNGETKNSWGRGRNTDIAPSLINVDQYVEAHNVEMVGDGAFYTLQNIKGTTLIKQLSASTSVEVLKDIPANFTISGISYKCIVYFTASTTAFNIWCYNIETNTLYALYQQTVTSDYLSADRVVDAVNYAENGTDFVYFTDFYNEVRSLKCEIPIPYVANFLSTYDISLLRKGANGTITLSSISGTAAAPQGTVLSGSYNATYRMCDPVNKRFTKWSTLFGPFHAYTDANTTNPVYSGIGLSTPRKITLTITPSAIEASEYSFIQLAIIENVGPTIQDINGVTSALPDKASLQEIVAFSGTSITLDYKSNTRIGTIPITDITIPLAPIERVKTINIKDNILFLGNVHYKALEFDNGTPVVTSGSFVKQFDASADAQDTFSSDLMASKYIGYFRNEVYRFGIVYYDADGNASPVKPFDFANKITGNIITGEKFDIKFPDRSTSNTYAIFNSSNQIISLGLQLNGILNHPTWAVAFEIVRVKRMKNILFQTPVIPMTTVEGIGALDNYPTKYNNGSETTVTDAQPQTADKILVPRNLFWPDMRNISRGTATTALSKPGEVSYTAGGNTGFTYSQIFPCQSMYGDTPFTFTGAEKLDFVDYAMIRCNHLDKSVGVTKLGDSLYTNVSGNFFAINEGEYYFDSTWAPSKAIQAAHKNLSIVDYEFFNNYDEAKSVAGISAFDYTSLQTTGVDFGYKPSTPKCAVVKLKGDLAISDFPNFGGNFVFKVGILYPFAPGGLVNDLSGVKYPSVNYPNDYITASGFSNNTTYVGAIGIANVTLGLGDDRYGDINAYHEYISTGAKYTFNADELVSVRAGSPVSKDITVFGGDCFIGAHTFKVCDSTYSITNQIKQTGVSDNAATLITKWGKYFVNTLGGTAISLPVAVENSAQYVQVILESEYSEVRDVDTLGKATTITGFPIYNNDSKDTMRVPLSYKYNLNLSKQNDRRIYLPKLLYSFEQNEFGARVGFSDIKIYNSDQAGFDIIRVGNFYDLEENKRNITKLALAGNNLYAIQEQGIVYLPTGEQQVEQTDGGLIAVGIDQVIGKSRIIDSFRGSQHLRGIVETGGVIYIPDNLNKDVYVLSGQELKSICKDNETEFRTMFANQTSGKNVIGIYNPQRGEYWLVQNSGVYRCEVWNEKLGMWISNHDFSASAKLYSGTYTNQNLYLIGTASDLSIHTANTGTAGQLFGVTVTPSVSFVVNPDDNTSKTFDNIMLAASQTLATASYTTQVLGTGQTVIDSSIDLPAREGSIRTHIPRDSAGGRLRGLRMITTIKWKDAVVSALQAVYTRYRLSSRSPF